MAKFVIEIHDPAVAEEVRGYIRDCEQRTGVVDLALWTSWADEATAEIDSMWEISDSGKEIRQEPRCQHNAAPASCEMPSCVRRRRRPQCTATMTTTSGTVVRCTKTAPHAVSPSHAATLGGQPLVWP